MVGVATFIAARQGGRIVVDDKGYHYKRTSTNKKTGVSYLRCFVDKDIYCIEL